MANVGAARIDYISAIALKPPHYDALLTYSAYGANCD